MSRLLINGKFYELTIDDMTGARFIDGVPYLEWVEGLPIADQVFLAKKGAQIAKNDPEYFDEIVERAEL